ncbi:MAG: element excision factor XisH family protein [Caldilineaceae bacterium]
MWYTSNDKIYEEVKDAIENDGWTITDDPLMLEYGSLRTFVDLGAERVIGVERNGEKIAVEIKSFLGRSVVNDIENALGQYVLYRSLLGRLEPERKLYVAVSTTAYKNVFQTDAVREIMEELRVSFMVVDLATKEITEWIKN